jgi:hypothetical protein
MQKKIFEFLSTSKQIFKFHLKENFGIIIWFALAIIGVSLELMRGIENINNYKVFKSVFWHTIENKNLFLYYPKEYFDVNLYGPVFSLVIAQFAILPDYLGCFLWCIANAWLLYFAIQYLPIQKKQKQIIFLISAIELMTSIQNVQFNPMLTSFIILSYIFVEKGKDFFATFFIALGFLTKVYGICGLAFFLFSKNKIKFVLSFTFWLIALVYPPVLISNVTFVMTSYKQWFEALIYKDHHNAVRITSNMQDISVMGFFRRVFKIPNLPNYYVTIPLITVYLLSAFRISQFKFLDFRLSLLASTLIGVVIFSSSAESPTYIIAVIGACIWYITEPRPLGKVHYILLINLLLFTILSPTDLFPKSIRQNYIIPYSLKVVPCFLIWVYLIKNQLFRKFSTANTVNNDKTNIGSNSSL